MDNSEPDYHDQLARLLELRALVDSFETGELGELEQLPPGRCADCARHAPLYVYGRVRTCRQCTIKRIRVRNALKLEELELARLEAAATPRPLPEVPSKDT